MSTQPNLPNVPSGPAGLMHEQTFNEALANALRARRRAWREDERFIIAERQQVFDDARRERPDILVTPPDIYPVVIEVEFGEPAVGDARSRLGRLVTGTPFPVRSAIAVGAPLEIRGWSNDQLRERLAQPEGLELRYAILSANIEGNETEIALTEEDVSYWPAHPNYVVGTVDDLAALCEYAAAPPTLNRSQGEIYICGVGRIGLGGTGQFCRTSLKDGPASPLDFLASVGQMGEKVVNLLLHRGLGSQAQVGGHFLTHPAPNGLVGVEVRAVTGQVHQAQANPGVVR